MRSQRPALGLLLAWLALLSMVLASVTSLAGGVGDHPHVTPDQQTRLAQDVGHPPGAPCESQEEPPAKPRRVSVSTLAKVISPSPAVTPRSSTQLIIDLLLMAPPQHQPTIVDATATPLPTPAGLRMQRGQAPPIA